MDWKSLGEAVVGLIVIAKFLAELRTERRKELNARAREKRDEAHREELHGEFRAFRNEMIARHDQIEQVVSARLTEIRKDAANDTKAVRVLVEGERGDNGVKSRVVDLEARVGAIEEDRAVAIPQYAAFVATVNEKLENIKSAVERIEKQRTNALYDRRASA